MLHSRGWTSTFIPFVQLYPRLSFLTFLWLLVKKKKEWKNYNRKTSFIWFQTTSSGYAGRQKQSNWSWSKWGMVKDGGNNNTSQRFLHTQKKTWLTLSSCTKVFEMNCFQLGRMEALIHHFGGWYVWITTDCYKMLFGSHQLNPTDYSGWAQVWGWHL